MGLNVLLCTDGSDLATAALRRALPVVASADRTVLLTVQSVVDPEHETGVGFTISAGTPDDDDQIVTSGDRAAKRIVDDTAAALGLDDVELMAKSGRPGHTICETAVAIDADVIVMGTQGLGGFRRAMVGSTSDHVIRHAPCAVLVQRVD